MNHIISFVDRNKKLEGHADIARKSKFKQKPKKELIAAVSDREMIFVILLSSIYTINKFTAFFSTHCI